MRKVHTNTHTNEAQSGARGQANEREGNAFNGKVKEHICKHIVNTETLRELYLRIVLYDVECG